MAITVTTPGTPWYDNVRVGGPDGNREPTEVMRASYALEKETDINFGGASTGSPVCNLTPDQAGASYFVVTNLSTAASVTFPKCLPGVGISISNASSAAVTFLVTGQSGISVGSSKHANLMMDNTAGDIIRISPDT